MSTETLERTEQGTQVSKVSEEYLPSIASGLLCPSVVVSENYPTDLSFNSEQIVHGLIEPKQYKTRKTTGFIPIQQWECAVESVNDGYVSVEMEDITDSSEDTEFAEIPIEQFQVSDRPLLAQGKIFYLCIGYSVRESGNIRWVTEIHLKRTPKLSKRRKALIEKEVDSIYEQLLD